MATSSSAYGRPPASGSRPSISGAGASSGGGATSSGGGGGGAFSASGAVAAAKAAAATDEEDKELAGTTPLELTGVIGFNGAVPSGFLLHPGDAHVIYPLGSTVVVRNLRDNSQTFLQKGGHNRAVSCLALSATGKYLASGQVTHMGFPAMAIIWNLETYEVVHRLVLHKGKIADLAFSPGEKYLATLGGRDDNKLVIWDVASGEAICGAAAASETTNTVRWYNKSDEMLVTGGSYNLRVWAFDRPNRKIRPSDATLGSLKRVITSIVIDEDDAFMYCGTKSGDVLQVSLGTGPYLFKLSGPAKRPFAMGISVVMRTLKGNIVVGAGDGTVALLKKDTFAVVKKTKLQGGITSLALNAAGDHFFVGTDKCNVYLVHLSTFEYELRNTCHNERINDVAFPTGYSELFATCSHSDIRVWQTKTRNELLRIQVPNLECLCVAFSADGKSIISGWDDGKIRAFGPQTGKLQYLINDAHNDGVTALACTRDCSRLVSGGRGGQVRVWAVGRAGAGTQKMIASMKEHKGQVNALMLNNDDTECVSASADGSCIVWNLERFVRSNCLFASTQFKAILYHPDQSQLLTTGTDRKLTYWDVVDGNPIRIIDGSASDQINTLAITSDGQTFVSGGGEKLVKLWGYDEGYCSYVGVGHSGAITQARISPDQQNIITVGDEGAVFIWSMPHIDYEGAAESKEKAKRHGGAGASSSSSTGGRVGITAGRHAVGAGVDEDAFSDSEREETKEVYSPPPPASSSSSSARPPAGVRLPSTGRGASAGAGGASSSSSSAAYPSASSSSASSRPAAAAAARPASGPRTGAGAGGALPPVGSSTLAGAGAAMVGGGAGGGRTTPKSRTGAPSSSPSVTRTVRR